MKEWNTVQGHTLLTDPPLKEQLMLNIDLKPRVLAFLTEEGNWPNHPEGVRIRFPHQNRYEPSCYGYYFSKGGSAGLIEFRQDGDTLKWRITSESEYPAYQTLDPDVIAILGPAPSREAERWRYVCYRHHNKVPPIVHGMGVTEYVGSDRYPHMVVDVMEGRQTIGIQRVHTRMIRGSSQSEMQHYEYGEPYGETVTIFPSRRTRDKGKHIWRRVGNPDRVYTVGYMDEYRDPSF